MSVSIVEAAGPALVIATLAAAASARFDACVRVGASIAGAALVLVPFGPQSFASFVLGLFGPVSAATLVLFATSLVGRLRDDGGAPTTIMLLSLLVVGVAFYLPTLGLTAFDPYEYGYRGLAVPALMVVIVALGWWRRAFDMPCWITLAAFLYLVGAYDSRNLWDYLIFPLDPVIAAIMLAVRALRSTLVKLAAVSPPSG